MREGPSNCGNCSSSRRRAIVAPLLPGFRRQPLERIRDHLAQERLRRVVADRALRAELLRHEIELLRRAARSCHADRDTTARPPKFGGELPLDAEAEPPVFGVGSIGRNDRPDAVAEIGAQPEARPVRLQQLTARDRVGQIGLEGQPAVGGDRHGRVPRVAQLVDRVGETGHRVDLEGRDEQPDAAADHRAIVQAVGEPEPRLEVVRVGCPRSAGCRRRRTDSRRARANWLAVIGTPAGGLAANCACACAWIGFGVVKSKPRVLRFSASVIPSSRS